MKRREILRDIFIETVKSGTIHKGSLNDLNYFALSCKAIEVDKLHKLYGSSCFMFKYKYDSKDAILILFAIPIKSDSGIKHMAEKVMEIITGVEKTFIRLDYSKSDEMKDEKFVYLTMVKKYDDEFLIDLVRKEIKKTVPKKKGEVKVKNENKKNTEDLQTSKVEKPSST